MSDFKQPGSPDEAAALLAEREHLRALLRMMPVGVFIVDAQGRPVEANPAARALWGGALPQVGLEGYGVYEGYWPGSGQRLEPHEWALARTLRDGQPVVNEEVDIVAFDGTRRTVLLSTQALRDGQGLLLGAVAVGVDITPHRQAEHARLEAPRAHDASRALLEGFFAASPVGMGFVDRELRYVDVNPVLAAINGLPREEHLGRRVHEVLSEVEESKHIEGLVRQVLESGEPWLNQDSLAPPRPGLPPRPVRSSLFPVKVDGQTLGVGAVVLDITEQKRVEEGLRFLAEATTRLSSSLDLRTTLENIARLVAEHMADYCLVDVRSEDGQRLERMAAVAREPGTQPLLDKGLCFSPPPRADSSIWRVLESGRAVLAPEVSAEMLDGVSDGPEHRALMERLQPRSAMVVPLVAREHTLGVLTMVSQDPGRRYTERDLAFVEDLAWRAALAVDNARLFHQAEQAVAARDEFVAIATHELRTPLSALSLQLAALQRALDSGHPPSQERLRQSLVTARRQTQRLEQLVDHLLDVSRISTGRLELVLEEVDLSALVHRLVARFEEKLAEAGCTPVVLADAPVVARVDRLRVEQVLMNLLSNAMKYAPGQPVELSVVREEAAAVLGVRDHGPGISPEAQARIFERFQRATGKHSRESLGLGLYVSRQIARAHGGELTVESTPGQGTHFRLRLSIG